MLVVACGGGDSGTGGNSGGGGGGGSTACSESARKQWVLDITREWYLFPELLPVSVNLDDFQTAEDLLDHLTATAREQDKDRFFSYLTTQTADNSLLGEGQFNGFGFRTRVESGSRVFVLEVFESTPAAEAGMSRGDEIVAIDAGSGFVPVTQLLAGTDTISDALGPAEVGVRRGLRLLRSGATREVSIVKRTVTTDPVSDVYGARVLPLAGTAGVGYLNLRTYISTAESQLRNAFADFRARGIDYFVIDLRYNGGGLVAISELLGDLLGGGRGDRDVMTRTVLRGSKENENTTRFFRSQPQSVRPVRIAFLTTEATASASEITINQMTPWVESAIVGADTYGKPVGQYAFDLRGCDDRMRLVSFRTVNSRFEGDYYDGLASQMQFACSAEDDLQHPLGDANEGMIAAGIDWLRTGACGKVIGAVAADALQKPRATVTGEDESLPRRLTPREQLMPGTD